MKQLELVFEEGIEEDDVLENIYDTASRCRKIST